MNFFLGTILLLDLVAKLILFKYFPSLLQLNSGVAFGLGNSWLAAIGLIPFIVAWLFTKKEGGGALWGLLVLAVIANQITRLTHGGVLDYLRLGSLYFNLTDIAILLIIGLLIYRVYKK